MDVEVIIAAPLVKDHAQVVVWVVVPVVAMENVKALVQRGVLVDVRMAVKIGVATHVLENVIKKYVK